MSYRRWGDWVELVYQNEAGHLPIGSMHRLSNSGAIPLALIEIRVDAYIGEHAIIRVEDVYGR